MAGKLPYIPFFVGDWLKDTRHLSLAARGAWIDILCAMHNSQIRGVATFSRVQMARYIGASSDQGDSVLAELTEPCNPTGKPVCEVENLPDGMIRLTSRRMVADERKRSLCSDAGRKGGGNPTLKGDVLTQPKGVPKGTLEDEDEVDALSFSEKVEILYQRYPRKVGKGAAKKAIGRALDKAPYDLLLEAVFAYAVARQGQDKQFTPHPATWFNEERWMDDRSEWVKSNGNGNPEPFSGTAAWLNNPEMGKQ